MSEYKKAFIKATENYNEERIKRGLLEKRETIYKEALEMIKPVECRCNCFVAARDALKMADAVKAGEIK